MLAGLRRAPRREIGQPRERLGGQAFKRLLISQKRSRIRVAQRLPNLPSVYHVLGNRSDRAPDAERKRSARGAPRAVKRALAAIDVDQMNVSRLKKCACRRAGVLLPWGAPPVLPRIFDSALTIMATEFQTLHRADAR